MNLFVVMSDDFQIFPYDTKNEALCSAKRRAESISGMDFYVFKLIAETVHHQTVEIKAVDDLGD